MRRDRMRARRVCAGREEEHCRCRLGYCFEKRGVRSSIDSQTDSSIAGRVIELLLLSGGILHLLFSVSDTGFIIPGISRLFLIRFSLSLTRALLCGSHIRRGGRSISSGFSGSCFRSLLGCPISQALQISLIPSRSRLRYPIPSVVLLVGEVERFLEHRG